MRKSILLSLIGLLGLIGPMGPLTAAAEVVDRVVAVVGNDIITLSDIKKYQASHPANAHMSESPIISGAAKDPLEALIREKILKAEMDRLNVTATDEEINGAIQDVLKRNSVSMDVLKEELGKKGMSMDQYKKDLGNQIKQMKFLSQVIFPRIKLSEEDIVKKAGANPSDEARMKARIELMQAKSSEELVKYLDEAREKTFIEIKK